METHEMSPWNILYSPRGEVEIWSADGMVLRASVDPLIATHIVDLHNKYLIEIDNPKILCP